MLSLPGYYCPYVTLSGLCSVRVCCLLCVVASVQGELFLLVTDQGFLTENGVVWETLSNVDGNCHFVDADFRSYGKPATAPTAQHSSFRYSCPDDQINAE